MSSPDQPSSGPPVASDVEEDPKVVNGPPRGTDRRLIGDLTVARRAVMVAIALGVVMTAAVVVQVLALAQIISWAMGSHPGVPTAAICTFAGALVVRSVAAGLAESTGGRAGVAVTTELRRRLLSAIEAEGPAGVAHRRTGAVVLTLTRGLRALEPYFSRYLPAAVVAAAAPPIILIVLAVEDWPSALIALGLVAVVPFAMASLGKRAQRSADREWRRLQSLSTRTLELLRGLTTLRSLGRVDRGHDEIEAAASSVAASIDQTLRASLSSGAALEFLAGVGVGLVAMLAGLRLLHHGLSVATALAVILLVPEVFLPLRRAGQEFHASTEGRAAAASVYALLDAMPPGRVDQDSRSSAALLPLRLREVSVAWPSSDATVLHDIDLTLSPGEQIVITGASGSGKSTLLAVLCGFVTPRSGRLLLGGESCGFVELASRRPSISLAPQRPHIFKGTVRHNLLLGSGSQERDGEIIDVLAAVGLSHLIADGLDAQLAEEGRSLSSGERQRIGLARVLLQGRQLVLLDEATSHLDPLTARLLGKQITPWLSGRTVVEVGHRPSLLSDDAQRWHLTKGRLSR